MKDRARELEEQQRGMKKKVNPKVMNMIDTWVPNRLPPALQIPKCVFLFLFFQRREARGEPSEDARHCAERQGEDRTDDRGT
jgi:hypothetical protein